MSEQLTFVVNVDTNHESTHLRIQKIGNGFVVRAGRTPIFYENIQSAANAIKDGLIALVWRQSDNKPTAVQKQVGK